MSTAIDETRFGEDSAEPIQLLAALVSTLDAIEEYSEFAFAEKRWPRLRHGDRTPITGIKRRLIFERDGQCCRNCGSSLQYREAQIDHIIPWSAWGTDRSCNLRILCEPCNTARSNFRSGLDTGPRPHVTTACTACAPYPADDEMIPAYCGRCGIISPTWPELVL